jgi:hypothetical protein
MSPSGADGEDSQGARRPSEDTEIDLALNQEKQLLNSKGSESPRKMRSSIELYRMCYGSIK